MLSRPEKKTQAEFAANATSDFLDILDVKLTGGTLPPKKAKDSEDATRRLYVDFYLGEAKWNVLGEKNVALPKEGFKIVSHDRQFPQYGDFVIKA